MVALTSFPPPDTGIVHREPTTNAFIKEKDYGVGTLFITESRVSWMSDLGEGFSLEYPSIAVHAVSRDTSIFPHECLYLLLDCDIGDDGERPAANESSDEDDEEGGGATEIRFAPGAKENLDQMYQAMCACQELHPDEEDSEDDYFGDVAGGDAPPAMSVAEANLERYEQLLGNGDIQEEAMEEEGQFDDREEGEEQ